MATTYKSDNLPALADDHQLWVYNGMDTCLTHEIHEKLDVEPGGFAYDMSRAMQGPALTMMRRGVRIDAATRGALITEFERDLQKWSAYFERLTLEGLGQPINPNSPAQLQILFYTLLKLPVITKYDRLTKQSRPTTDRDALEKLQSHYTAQIFVTLLLAIRDTKKRLDVLRSGVDEDGRLRCHYYVTGTYTGRWSSAKNVFNRGTNLQNISDPMRRLFIPDPGKKLGNIDLRQAESVLVAYLSGDRNYIEAVRSGDPHTYVCTLVWTDLGWQHANSKSARRAIAEKKYYRHYTYRDIAKRGGHGSNYGGTPHILAMHLKVERKIASDFQDRYFTAFPGIRKWQTKVDMTINTKRQLKTAFGRVCQFMPRPGDSSVLKAAIAYEPQSTIGDYLNLGLYNVWQLFDLTGKIELLAQVHDSILFQYDPADEAELLPAIQSAMRFPLLVNDQECFIETEVSVGWNWGKQKDDNPHGITEWKGSDSRTPPTQAHLLDRRVCDLHRL